MVLAATDRLRRLLAGSPVPGGRVPITVVRYRIIDEEDLWVPSSRSVASACRRRSTARCFAVPAFSGGSSASRKPPSVGSVAFSPAPGRRGPRITGGCAFRRFRGRVPWQRSLQGGSRKCRRRAFGRHLPLPRCGYRCCNRAPACQRAMSAAPALSRGSPPARPATRCDGRLGSAS